MNLNLIRSLLFCIAAICLLIFAFGNNDSFLYIGFLLLIAAVIIAHIQKK